MCYEDNVEKQGGGLAGGYEKNLSKYICVLIKTGVNISAYYCRNWSKYICIEKKLEYVCVLMYIRELIKTE